MRTFLGLLALLLGAAGAAAVWGWHHWRALEEPLPLMSEEILEIPSGRSERAVLEGFFGRGWVSRPGLWLLRLEARREPPPPIRAGEYRLQPGWSLRQVLAHLRSGEVVLHRLQIIEGWTLREALAAVRAHPAITVTLPEEAWTPEELMGALGFEPRYAEGWLRPDTYLFPRGTTDVAFLRRAVKAQQAELERVWAARQPDLPLASPDELLVLASIVEKETGLAEERRKVAGVFINRLRIPMRLQTDPTVIYGLGPDFDGRLRRVHLTTDHPWNTYTRDGLPPTPIALPGRASLEAAADPEATSALYFVAVGDGSGAHVFSDTLEEHNRAVAAYRRRLREARNAAP